MNKNRLFKDKKHVNNVSVSIEWLEQIIIQLVNLTIDIILYKAKGIIKYILYKHGHQTSHSMHILS